MRVSEANTGPAMVQRDGVLAMVTSCAPLSGEFGDGEQHGGVFKRFEGVSGVGHDEQVACSAFAGDLVGGQADLSVKDVDGGFAGIFVFVQGLAGAQGDEGLPEGMGVSADDGLGATAAGRAARRFEVLEHEGDQR
jgi:hypothetical protein